MSGLKLQDLRTKQTKQEYFFLSSPQAQPSVKNTIFHSPLLQNATQTLTPPSPPPMTTSGHHEPSLLVAEPPHQEKHLNRSGILRILLKDLVDKIPPILHFKASLR
ncbi:hypothetical protein HKD37_14G040124 [Glycine soja]